MPHRACEWFFAKELDLSLVVSEGAKEGQVIVHR